MVYVTVNFVNNLLHGMHSIAIPHSNPLFDYKIRAPHGNDIRVRAPHRNDTRVCAPHGNNTWPTDTYPVPWPLLHPFTMVLHLIPYLPYGQTQNHSALPSRSWPSSRVLHHLRWW